MSVPVASPDANDRGTTVWSRLAPWTDTLVLGAAVVVLLGATIAVDPPSGVTASNSPFTDEAWNVVNARNFVLLGRWSTDDWNLYLVNFPFSLLQALAFAVTGVGIIQARLVPILATALTVGGLAWWLRGLVGRWPARLAALGLGSSALVLYYGRLAYLEPLVSLFLVLGLATAFPLMTMLAPAREGGGEGEIGGERGGERDGGWGGGAFDRLRSAHSARPALLPGAVAGLLFGLAVWTKPSAAFAVAGIVLGVGLGGLRRPTMRAWAIAAVSVVAVGVGAWMVLVWRTNSAAVATDLAIWASEPLPRSIGELLRRVTSYPARSDGAIPLTLPLVGPALVGALVVLLRWRDVPPGRRALCLAAFGWAALGVGALFAVSYRPNRYVVPMLPAFAIMLAVGVATILDLLRMRDLRARRPWLAIGALGLVALVAAPGPALDAGWMTATGSTMPAIQARVMAVVPAGAALEGDLAPLFGMRVPGLVLVSRPEVDVNPGDLYATRAVRWVVLDAGQRPVWADAHAAAWQSRATIFCVPWGAGRPCLVRVP